jgi:hypothetical protein
MMSSSRPDERKTAQPCSNGSGGGSGLGMADCGASCTRGGGG